MGAPRIEDPRRGFRRLFRRRRQSRFDRRNPAPEPALRRCAAQQPGAARRHGERQDPAAARRRSGFARRRASFRRGRRSRARRAPASPVASLRVALHSARRVEHLANGGRSRRPDGRCEFRRPDRRSSRNRIERSASARCGGGRERCGGEPTQGCAAARRRDFRAVGGGPRAGGWARLGGGRSRSSPQ